MKLVWLDCETSGLSPEKHALLEVAVGIADLSVPFDLKTLDRFVLKFTDAHTLGARCALAPLVSDGARDAFGADGGHCPACDFDPVARTLHGRSGLLAECARSTTTVGEVEDFLLTRVPPSPWEPPQGGYDKPTLAGSSVHFDFGFLRAKMPRVASRLSHRLYDVSAVKLFCESLGMPRIPKAEAHRALEDVAESIDHARECVHWLASTARVPAPLATPAGRGAHGVREQGVDPVREPQTGHQPKGG